LRNGNEELGSKPNFEILHTGILNSNSFDRTFFYKRGAFIIGLNPGADGVQVSLPVQKTPELAYSIGGCGIENGVFKLEPQSFGVWKC
jgi:hypothetical protein